MSSSKDFRAFQESDEKKDSEETKCGTQIRPNSIFAEKKVVPNSLRNTTVKRKRDNCGETMFNTGNKRSVVSYEDLLDVEHAVTTKSLSKNYGGNEECPDDEPTKTKRLKILDDHCSSYQQKSTSTALQRRPSCRRAKNSRSFVSSHMYETCSTPSIPKSFSYDNEIMAQTRMTPYPTPSCQRRQRHQRYPSGYQSESFRKHSTSRYVERRRSGKHRSVSDYNDLSLKENQTASESKKARNDATILRRKSRPCGEHFANNERSDQMGKGVESQEAQFKDYSTSDIMKPRPRKVCFFFNRGYCFRGNNCRFRHVSVNETADNGMSSRTLFHPRSSRFYTGRKGKPDLDDPRMTAHQRISCSSAYPDGLGGMPNATHWTNNLVNKSLKEKETLAKRTALNPISVLDYQGNMRIRTRSLELYPIGDKINKTQVYGDEENDDGCKAGTMI